MSWRHITIALLIIATVALTFWLGRAWARQREWSDLQHRQLAAIMRLQQHPPARATANQWREHVVTLHNVWGNVLYTPSYCGLSSEEMQALLSELDQTVNQTTADNSTESVDQVYGILSPYAKNPQFVAGYRDEFQRMFGNSQPSASEK